MSATAVATLERRAPNVSVSDPGRDDLDVGRRIQALNEAGLLELKNEVERPDHHCVCCDTLVQPRSLFVLRPNNKHFVVTCLASVKVVEQVSKEESLLIVRPAILQTIIQTEIDVRAAFRQRARKLLAAILDRDQDQIPKERAKDMAETMRAIEGR